MSFRIRMGVPEMEAYWNGLVRCADEQRLSPVENRRFQKLVKVIALLSANPRHPSLATHEIDALSRRYGMKVWQSYLENRVPAAGRLYWVYGPDRNELTLIGIQPHPEDRKHGAYDRIKLSGLPE